MTNNEIWNLLMPNMQNASNQRTLFGGRALDAMNIIFSLKGNIYKTFSKSDPYRQDMQLREFSDWLKDRFQRYTGIIHVRAEGNSGVITWQYGYNQILTLFEEIAEYLGESLPEDFYITDEDNEDNEEQGEPETAPATPQKAKNKQKEEEKKLVVLERIENHLMLIYEILQKQHNHETI